MESFTGNPAFTTFAICSAILALKTLLSGAQTAITRLRSKRFINPEDARVFGGGADPVTEEDEGVKRALRIQRNDGESLPLFCALGLVFVLTGASAFAAAAYFWSFTVARIAHTLFYAMGVQPLRTAAFAIATLSLTGMSVQILMSALG